MPDSFHFNIKERRQAYYALHNFSNTKRPTSRVLAEEMSDPWSRAFSLSVQLWCPPGDWEPTTLSLGNLDLAVLAGAFRSRDDDLHEQFLERVHYPLTDDTGYGSNWQGKREEVLESHGRYCDRCRLTEEEHMEKYGTGLHIHHKIPLREFDNVAEANRLDNLVPLCAECHRTVESD